MNCPIQTKDGRGADLILDYCADRLAPEAVLEFERHLPQCEDCARVVEAQRSVWTALDHFEAPAISADFDEKLWKRIEESEARPWWRRVFDGPLLGWSGDVSWKPAFVTASACAAVFVVMLAIRPSSPVPPAAAAPAASIAVDFDQVEMALDDLDMLNQMGVVDDRDPA